MSVNHHVIRLRGHHLLCILAYIGKGYTPEFTKNFDQIVARINDGATIILVTGKDDICAALHDQKGPVCDSGEHCVNDSVTKRDNIAMAAIATTLGRDVSPGATIRFTASDIIHLRKHFASGALRQACIGCEWQDICSDISDNNFRHVRLMPEAVS